MRNSKTKVYIRLRKEDVMEIQRKDRQKLIAVNGVGIFYITHGLYTVHRGVLGVSLCMPSVHPQRYFFNNGQYQESWRPS